MNVRQASVLALVVCAVSDLAAAPLLIGSDDAPAGTGIAIAVLGVLTLLAAVGVARSAGWANPLALGTRVLDVVAAVPALFAGLDVAETSAAVVTVLLSLATIALLLRPGARPARVA